jgi:hypothetical protein
VHLSKVASDAARYKRLSASPVTPFWGHLLSILGSWGIFCLLSCLGYDYQSRPVWASSVASGLPLGSLWEHQHLFVLVFCGLIVSFTIQFISLFLARQPGIALPTTDPTLSDKLILVLICVRGTGSCSLLRSGQSGTCRSSASGAIGERRTINPVGWRFQNCRSLRRIWVVRVRRSVDGGVYSPTHKRKKNAMTTKSATMSSLGSIDVPSWLITSWNAETGSASWGRGAGSSLR